MIIKISPREATLKRRLRRHLSSLGFTKAPDGSLVAPGTGKDMIRAIHAPQRADRLESSQDFISRRFSKLSKYFAAGKEVTVPEIKPFLQKIRGDTWESDLFRMASLTWSVPVSSGFGRRIRYLVWDQNNGKLMGLIALGDPVFNLSVRDNMIGWDVHARGQRLVNILDAYVLGAIPPYNALLGGKMIACLIRSKDIYNDFADTYGHTAGIISNIEKKARLLMVTTSSSMGRSSVYNRLKLNNTQYFQSIGFTGGWGHFHIPDDMFCELRSYLREIGHPYADLHKFGEGPNWRLRTIRAALTALGFKEDLLRHGIQREVFMSQLADNGVKILRTGRGNPDTSSLLSAREVADLALNRWLLPRSERRPEFRSWEAEDLKDLLLCPQKLANDDNQAQLLLGNDLD